MARHTPCSRGSVVLVHRALVAAGLKARNWQARAMLDTVRSSDPCGEKYICPERASVAAVQR